MLVFEFIRDVLTTSTERNNTIAAEMKVITTLRYLATLKTKTEQLWWLGSVATFYRQNEQINNYSTFAVSYFELCQVSPMNLK